VIANSRASSNKQGDLGDAAVQGGEQQGKDSVNPSQMPAQRHAVIQRFSQVWELLHTCTDSRQASSLIMACDAVGQVDNGVCASLAVTVVLQHVSVWRTAVLTACTWDLCCAGQGS
jgi:hypothetical protein